MADLAEIEAMIEAALPGAAVEVVDETGAGDHLRATVAAPQFEGLSRIDQHRLVKAAVKERFDDGQIHALSMQDRPPRVAPSQDQIVMLSSRREAGGDGRRYAVPMADPQLKEKVEELIAANPVLLFMKGTPEMPRCGFSMRVVQVLDTMDVEYGAIDVLPALQPLREVTAEISDWQTFPQLYVNGELLGGADIVEEMFESGELAEALGVEQPAERRRGAAQSPPLQIE